MAFEDVSFVQKSVSIVDASGNPSTLQAPTALQWGPDGFLYVASTNFQGDKPGADGQVFKLSVVKNLDGSYTATIVDQIGLVADIPNHDDDGTPNPGVIGRQVTGIAVGGTAENPVLFVTSSDPRVGGGTNQTDTHLDTNSGIISQLTPTGPGGAWEKIDLVRGLPRSEENHATNGVAIRTDPQTGEIVELLVGQGGHTNAGSPSEFLPGMEYAYSAAILSVDYQALMSRPVQGVGTANPYIYDLPTLDSPNRANTGSTVTIGVDTNDDGTNDYFYTVAPEANDPFGGEDGLNQAKLTPDSPVQIYSSGYRNPYDILITKDGNVFSYDNGANAQWGLPPVGTVNGQRIVEEAFDTDPSNPDNPDFTNFTPTNEPRPSIGNNFTKNYDSFHHITAPGYYAGHPNPVRAAGSAAGLWDLPGNGIGGATQIGPGELPVDFGEVVWRTNSVEGDYREGGIYDGAVDSGKASINGLAEFTGSAFGGAIKGAILATEFSGSSFQLIIIGRNAQGGVDTVQILDKNNTPNNPSDDFFVTTAAQRKAITINIGDVLGIDALGDGGQFSNTIWLTSFGKELIVMEPGDGSGVPTTQLNQDGDGLVSAFDPFDYDSANGAGDGLLQFPGENRIGDGVDSRLGIGETFFLGLSPVIPRTFNQSGFTGAQINGVDSFQIGGLLPNNGLEASLATAGSAALFKQASIGSARGTQNNAQEQYQFGLLPEAGTRTVIATATYDNWVFLVDNTTNPPTPLAQPGQRIGMFVGTGDQDNYVNISVATAGTASEVNGGASAGATVRVSFENGPGQIQDFEFAAVQTINGVDYAIDDPAIGFDWIQTRFSIDLLTGQATPQWRFGQTSDIDSVAYPDQEGYPPESVLPFMSGAPVTLTGATLGAIRGQNTVGGLPVGMAIGMYHNAVEGANNFSWAYRNFAVEADGAPGGRGAAVIAVNAGAVSDQFFVVDGAPVLFETDVNGLDKGVIVGKTFVFPDGAGIAAALDATDFGGTDLDGLHTRERFTRSPSFGYEIPVANGVYEVDLYFAETFFGGPNAAPGGVGKRIFDVFVEDSLAASRLDIFERVGALNELKITHRFEVTDGAFSLSLENAGPDNPTISAFALYPASQTVTVGNQAPINIALSSKVVDSGDVGAVIGAITVTDLDDAPGSHRFLVNDSRFAVLSNGNLVLLDGQSIDFAEEQKVELLITAVDPDDAMFTERFTINVNNTGPDPFLAVVANETAAPGAVGSAVVRVSPGIEDVAFSTFSPESFVIQNVGDKKIAGVFFDISEAVYTDVVFDPFGESGDTVFKPLRINDPGFSGVIDPESYDPYFGPGGALGFSGLLLQYSLAAGNGFNAGETMTFSIDADPLSVDGFGVGALQGASNPAWDPGGVSGAMLINSTITVLFSDGSRASGQLMSDGSQAGAQALITEAPAAGPVGIKVNGLNPGGVGVYGGARPLVQIEGPVGATARVVMTKGFIQPVLDDIGAIVASRLAGQDFLANNPVEFQIVDVVLTGGAQNISSLFDYNNDPNGFVFDGSNTLPIAFVASVIDPARDNLPIGPVSTPIYLASTGEPVGDVLFAPVGGGRVEADPGVALITGSDNDDVLINRFGDNTIDANGGNNLIVTGSGANTITAGDGNNVVKSGAGNDVITLGGGDNVILTGGGDNRVTTGDGDNVVRAGGGADVIRTGGGTDRIATGSGEDTIFAGAGDDVILPGRGDDIVDAGSGNDVVRGFRGNEVIFGGSGADVLFGGLDDDTLIGGAGNDRLVGGPGLDKFIFSGANFGDDRVLDFRVGSDQLVFAGVTGVDGVEDLDFRQLGGNVLIDINGVNSSVVLGSVDLGRLLAFSDSAFAFQSDPVTLNDFLV